MSLKSMSTQVDVMNTCAAAVAACLACIQQCKNCMGYDAVHEACIEECGECIVSCMQCSADCSGSAPDAQVLASCAQCVSDCNDCIAMCASCAQGCQDCADTCSACSTACQTCSTSCASNANLQPMSAVKFAIKAVGDFELDVLAIPFNSVDSDGQWFDANTDIMPDVFNAPLVAYQHGVSQGAKALQAHPIQIGTTVPGSLEKKADGWHIRVVLNKALAIAKSIMDAAKQGMVAVSSGSISHLARLDVAGKLMPYEKDKPGRITVWPFAELSLWERGNGNFDAANRFAMALPAMKAIYRDAGIHFPVISDAVLPEAQRAAKRARAEKVQQNAKDLLKRINA